ncbi:MAG: DNA-binding response OmpR family regulator [Bradymonadia bacterium]|jgi:DNA-binding response OmpR family regulator
MGSCDFSLVESAEYASFVLAIGPPEHWPAFQGGVSETADVCVWFEQLLEEHDYNAARRRLPGANFLHGERGMEVLEALLVDFGLSQNHPIVDDAGLDAFFDLKGEYLENLINEYRTFLSSRTLEEPELTASWRDYLQRVEGGAGTYEFISLSDAARRARTLFSGVKTSPDTEEQAAGIMTSAINEAAETHREALAARMPERIAHNVRHRALILADEHTLAQQLRLALTHTGLEAVVHNDPTTFYDALRVVRPDVIIVQRSLEGFDGFDLAAQIRSDATFSAVPVVGLLDDTAESTRTYGARCGIDTFLFRPFSAENAVKTVGALLARNDEMLALGGRDPVTGLYTKRALSDRLELELMRARRGGDLVALMLIHIESGGDARYPRQSLIDLAHTAESTFRRSDILGSYNERTVAAVLPGADPRVLASLMHRLVEGSPPELNLRIAASLAEGTSPAAMVLADAETRLLHALDGKLGSAVGRCAARPEEETTRGHAPRILLVDNDEAILTLLTFFCEREGFVVEIARDGLAAIEALETAARTNTAPDLVIMEAYLPGVDGFSVLRKIQADFGARVSVMMLTIQRNEERIAKAFNLGAADFVAKPFSVPEVIARIKNILLRSGAL